MFKSLFTCVAAIMLMHPLAVLAQLDSTKILHISPNGSPSVESVSLLNSDFTSLSLIDSTLYDDFEDGVKVYQSVDKNVLVTVTRGESEQRMEFIGLFYGKWLAGNDISKAYKSSVTEIRKKYPRPDFKSKLFLKKD